MDFIALETQFEMQVMRNQALIEVVSCVRKDILHLEEDENKRLSSSSNTTKGVLEVKIGELRARSIKCHEIQRAHIDEVEQLKEFRLRQVDGQLEGQLEKCIGQEKAANKYRCENMKAKLRIEEDHGALLTKTLKDLTKSMSIIKVLNFKSGVSSGDHVSLINYVDERLKGKQKDFERLGKQKARIEKLKENVNERGRMPDDLSSIASSEMDSVSESDNETSLLSKMLQENIALTLEKQKLEDEAKFSKEKKQKLADTIADTKERVRVLQEKVDEHKLVKEKERSLQDSLREVEDGIAKCALDCGALQSEVEQNNVQIQTLKDDIALLQKQAQGKEVDEEEMRKVQELDEALNEKKQHLEINMQKIEEKVKENCKLKQNIKEKSAELEQLKVRNSEDEEQLKVTREKNEEELHSLTTKIKQMNKDIHNKTENTKNVNENCAKLDVEIEECSRVVSHLKGSLEHFRQQKMEIETEISNINSEINKAQNIVPSNEEEAQLEESIAANKVKLQEKKKERDFLVESLRRLRNENQTTRDLLNKAQELTESERLKQEAASAGILSWLSGWASSSKQEPSN